MTAAAALVPMAVAAPSAGACLPAPGYVPPPPLPFDERGPSLAVPGLDPEVESFGATAERTADNTDIVVREGVFRQPLNSCGPRSRIHYIEAVATSGVEIASPQRGRVDVVTRGSDGALWHAGATNDGVIGWERLGGTIVGTPTIAATPTRMFAMARGTDGLAYPWAFVDGAWQAGGQFVGVWSSDLDAAYGGPSDTFPGADRVDYVGLGTHGLVCHAANLGVSVECFPGGYTSSPSIAVEPGANRAWIFVRGIDDALYVNRFTNATSWSGWQLVGGILTSAPDAAYVPGVGVRVAMLGTDRATWFTEGDTTFAPFTRTLPNVA